jgi:uncharacterized phage-associated protein
MFVFKFDKAIQAAAYLISRESCKEMNYMRLLKIIFIADRESIRQTGRPITGDKVVAMERGPVLSNIFDLIKGCHLRSPEWARLIRREEFNVRLMGDPTLANLSRFDIETLEKVAEEHRSHDEWKMVEITHEFPEWQKNKPENSSMNEIPFIDILEALGRSADLPEIEEDAKTDQAFAHLFGT